MEEDDSRTVVRTGPRPAAPVDDDATVIRPAPAFDPDATVVRPVSRPGGAVAPAGGATRPPVSAPVSRPSQSGPASASAGGPVSGSAGDARRTLAPIALQPGHRLHEYRIDRVLGQGGFGITYLATDVNLHAEVAIKEYLPAEFAIRTGDSTVRPRRIEVTATLLEGLDQFLVEARTLASFRHPNIVRVARFFEANRTAYMVLDYERGAALGAWWRKQRPAVPAGQPLPMPGIPEPELLMLLAPLLDGLALVHHKGVLHRDIKPDNVLVRDADGSFVLLDFGAARPAAVSNASDAPSILTPGYAPIEQYLGDQQGPWTDIYAFGATLYWLVCGQRPREAPDRQAAPQADTSAEQAGMGRYSAEFLRAIDWALQVRPADRPQDVAAFRRALFAAHAASLGLQEALARGMADEDAQRATGQGFAARLRAGLRRAARSRVLRPPSWPLALKMALALVLAALVPMGITAWHNYTSSVDALARAERRNLSGLAQATAGRLSQLIEDSRRVTAFAARSPEVAALLRQPSEAGRAAVLARLQNFVDTNPDLHLLTLMDASGKALVSTAPEVVGGNYGFRDYFKIAMAGRSNVTSIIVGAVAGRAGVYVAYPVRDAAAAPIGVIVLRLRAETIGALVDGVRNADRDPFLVDGDGVLIHDGKEALRFHSLAPLSAQKQADIAADQRFRLKHVESLGMPELAAALVGARREGVIDYDSTITHTREVAGYAPVAGVDWVVGVTESRASFEAPLRAIFEQVLIGLGLVGAIFVGLALLFARSISRPVAALTGAVDALKRGDYDAAHVKVRSDDEIGALGRTFNVMIDVLRQRERERGMRSGSS
ncbi:MAG: protein kinase [Pelomonas sp.]|nr:protein kinase [Roseateles sp.]